MKKGTKITNKAYPFNPDGDHEIDFGKTQPLSEDQYNAIFDDPSHFFMHTHIGNIYGVNKLKFRGKRFPLLEPNPVTFYFSIAFDTSLQIEQAYKQLENSLVNANTSWPLSGSYSFVFRVAAISIIFAFTTCDAFLNQNLPDFKEVVMTDGKSYNKKQIEYFNFERKFQAVSIITGKDFAGKHPRKMERLLEIKVLRNQLIHLKEVKQGIATSYNDIYQSVLDLNIKMLVNTVKAFVNFYEPKLIVNYTYK
jgi:hypothetical protein